METLPKYAFDDKTRVLLTLVNDAFVADKFVIEVVAIETLLNEAFVNKTRVLPT